MTFIPLEIADRHGRIETVDGPRTTTSLHYRRSPLADSSEQLERLALVSLDEGPTATGDFNTDIASAGWPEFRPQSIEIFQINLGKLCNMTCRHCHVDAGPDRDEENMDRDTADACLRAIDRSGASTVDLTGGAPELNPNFEYLVDACTDRGVHVMVRSNLTILVTRRFEHLPDWFSERRVEVVCSLPHYRKLGTDSQRGEGAYEKSIEALSRLNAAGYGKGDPDRRLVLVTNPVGAFIAGSQPSLEAEWKEALLSNHGVQFDRLLTLNNMPIARYLEWLIDKGLLESYMERLLAAFNPATIAGLMCRNTLSVGWDGRLYDCDFNQQLDMLMELRDGVRPHVSDFEPNAWRAHSIRTARHCYGCTAGAGSSCGGAIA
ncbi:MAG TPA: arsenosugar biosynthesis radical SAM (seleno)protein ArsS [Rhodothermales bacterium]|nr:arsenosugar biosynthesis radical SAM (seleno)protein ArsS [Rhodothermales bacterium]